MELCRLQESWTSTRMVEGSPRRGLGPGGWGRVRLSRHRASTSTVAVRARPAPRLRRSWRRQVAPVAPAPGARAAGGAGRRLDRRVHAELEEKPGGAGGQEQVGIAGTALGSL